MWFLQGAAERRGLLCARGGALLIRMQAQMLLERLFVAEALATVGARVGVLARVHPLVFQQILPAGKGLEALCTAVPPLTTGVAGLVAEEGLSMTEALPTFPARVQLGTSLVHTALVLHQMVCSHKALVTLPTAVRSLPGVDTVVVC